MALGGKERIPTSILIAGFLNWVLHLSLCPVPPCISLDTHIAFCSPFRNYSCESKGSKNTDFNSSDMFVMPILISLSLHPVPPRITLDPVRQVVRPGAVVQIRCSATGPQPITINWTKEAGRMPASVIINGGELTVSWWADRLMFRGGRRWGLIRYGLV